MRQVRPLPGWHLPAIAQGGRNELPRLQLRGMYLLHGVTQLKSAHVLYLDQMDSHTCLHVCSERNLESRDASAELANALMPANDDGLELSYRHVSTWHTSWGRSWLKARCHGKAYLGEMRWRLKSSPVGHGK
jgi:hypothetical protein